MSSRTFVRAGASAVAALAALASATAHADPDWSKLEAVSPPGNRASSPAAGIDAKGGATIVWMQVEGITGSEPSWRIHSATRPAGGKWLVGKSPLSDEYAFAPSLAVGGNGTAVAAWELRSDALKQVQASSRQEDGAFGAPVPLSTPPMVPGGAGAGIALDAMGDGAVAYELIASSANRLEVWPVTGGVIAGAKATFDGFIETSPAFTNRPAVLAGPVGTYVAFSRRFFPVTKPYLLGPLVGGAFPEGTEIMPEGYANGGSARVAATPAGELVKAFRTLDGIFVAVGSEDPQRVSGDVTDDAFSPEVAAGPDGTIVAAWVQEGTDGTFRDQVKAAVRPAGAGTFEPPVELSELGDSVDPPRIVFSGTTAIVVWSRDTGLFSRVETSDRPAGSDFDAVADTLSGAVNGSDGSARFPSIAAAPSGAVVVTWAQTFSDEDTGRLYERVVATTLGSGKPDAKAPRLTKMKVSPERFGAGATLGATVVAAEEKTVMYPDGQGRRPLRAGTEFVFRSNEAGTYVIDVEGVGCSVFLPEGRRKKPREQDAPGPCAALGQEFRLTGTAVKGKKTRVAFLGAGLQPGGRYAATLTVTDAAGNVSKSRTATFHFDGP